MSGVTVQQFIDVVERRGRQNPLAERVLQEHVPEKLHVVEMFEGLPVSVICAEYEGPRIESSILEPGVVEGLAETLVHQVAENRIVTKKITNSCPCVDVTEGSECHYLEDLVLLAAWFVMVADFSDHVL